jgi:FkbM family methyltransferase
MKTIFDIGFEDGSDTAYYLYRGYNVIAVDADPKLVEAGMIRFEKEIKEGRLTLLNLGISDTKETKPFFVNTYQSEWSSFIERLGARNDPNYYSIQVECAPLGNLLLKYGTPFYLKIDIEGNDILGLESMLKTPQEKPKYISIEAADIKWMDKLVELGYTKFKLVNQAIVQKQSTMDWDFKLGCSGNFGEDAPGDWVSASELVSTFNFLHHTYNASPDSWYDIHAKF